MTDAIHQFLEAHSLAHASDLAALAKAVAAIPWGEARTVDDVLRLNKGTCTGKHLLLQECLTRIGIPHRPVVCTFLWEKQGIDLPADLRAILQKHSWAHGHNFVQILGSAGTWIDVDITWDPALAPYGFRSFPTQWDGKTPFVGVQYEKRWDGADIGTMKDALIAGLSVDQREARARFLEGLIRWIDAMR